MEPKEVKEEPMTMTRAQEQQRLATVKAKRKSGASSFFSTLLFLEGQYEASKTKSPETANNKPEQ
jgi:hypothetical protein